MEFLCGGRDRYRMVSGAFVSFRFFLGIVGGSAGSLGEQSVSGIWKFLCYVLSSGDFASAIL